MINSLHPSLRIKRVRKITRGDHLSTNWVCVEDGPKHFTITHRYNTNNHSQVYRVQYVIFISFRDPNRLLLDRRKICRRHAPRWLVTWGVVLAVIGHSIEATTPGMGLLLARDTGIDTDRGDRRLCVSSETHWQSRVNAIEFQDGSTGIRT